MTVEIVRTRHGRLADVGRAWRRRGTEGSSERGGATVITNRKQAAGTVQRGTVQRGVVECGGAGQQGAVRPGVMARGGGAHERKVGCARARAARAAWSAGCARVVGAGADAGSGGVHGHGQQGRMGAGR